MTFALRRMTRPLCSLNLNLNRQAHTAVPTSRNIELSKARSRIGTHVTPMQHRHRLLSFGIVMASAAFSTSTALSASTISVAPQAPKEYFRLDYKPSAYLVSDIYLDFAIDPSNTIVTATSTIMDGHGRTPNTDLVLDGEDLDLKSVSVNKVLLPTDAYSYEGGKLTIKGNSLPRDSSFELSTQVVIHPDKNLALSGLYKSGSSLLCTQCEAMGFRRIAFHLDRPDILTRYKVRLEADKAAYPVLLSNGNQIGGGDIPGTGKHWALWEDPFPKPSYLFALVAGDIGSIHDEYITTSGRRVKLGIYSDKENVGKLQHAMYSIKESMKWDEQTFGLECDLDVYNIVATNDFNMGAMENKGLNIFNSAYVLADAKTATDSDYERILGVIAHEYFHNWTGNRVTVRDWFQLTLKEGLTVFRDQWFSSDVTSHAVKRIEDVRMLRSRQFAEDQGPMSHPIRPESYISMDNFYTGTVYIKGAEVVRLYRTLLGEEGFKKGMKLYFERHDGAAVTCDDFRAAMADANGVDLSQLERWYSQAGTPIVDVSQSYDAATKTYTLTLSQHTPSTPGQPEASKLPLMIPVVCGLLSPTTGKELVPSRVLKLTEATQSFVFENVAEKPIPSLLRDFSAPVKLRMEQSNSDLAFLMSHDTDGFNKWDAGHKLSSSIILSLAKLSVEDISKSSISQEYIDAIRTVLTSCSASSSSSSSSAPIDASLIAYALQLPDDVTLSLEMSVIDPDRLSAARDHVKLQLMKALKPELEAAYASTASTSNEYIFSPQEVGRRRLRNTILDYLSSEESTEAAQRAKKQFDDAVCMSDKINALACLTSFKDAPEREEALATFHKDAAGDALVLNKWFAIQATADIPDLLERVKALKKHPDFIISNPNRARSLISTFAGNLKHFHAKDGSGYRFIAECVKEIDALNPQVAARLAQSFSQWKRFDNDRQTLMKAELQKIKDVKGLSKDTFEVVSRCLQ